jgi:hypothetical protein
MRRAAPILASLAALAWLVALPGGAAAHQVWLERDGDTVLAFFGEPVENLRERSGGLLDRIATPRIFVGESGQPLTLRRAESGIEAKLPAGAGDVRLVEEGLAPYGRAAGERTKAIMLAREGRQESRAVLELELVPQAPGSNRFTLFFRNRPMPRAEVTLVAPPRWERRLRTDDQGQVTFDVPWAGRYVAEAAHVDATPGGEGDGAYARRRLVSTISFTVEQGIPWIER